MRCLILTVAPFGLIAPWLGPAIDRLKGGHRYMVIGSAVVRATLALLMALNTDSLVMFPLAFGMLVMGKAYHVAKSAMVPTLVPDETRLVQANSRLSIITALSAAVAGIPGVLLLTIGGASWTLYFDVLIFLAAAALAMKIPATKVASEKANETERHELRGNNIVLAASAMGYMRAVVGFLTMLLAFELRGGVDPGPTATGVEIGHRIRELTGLGRLDLSSGGAPAWHFGVVLAFTGLGGLGGAVTSPRLRAMVKEEKILAGSLAGVGVAGVLALLAGGLVGAATIAFAVGVAGAMGKQSFDAIVQRDAPEANLGRSFAKFESQFQLLWVFGAVIPVIIPIPARLGFLGLAGTAGFAAVSYYLGRDPAPTVKAPKAATERLRRVSFRRGRTAADTNGADTGTIDLADRPPATETTDLFDQDLFADDDPVFEAEPTREYVLPPQAPPTGPPTVDRD
ncbi:MAG: MFS transporter [Acidimicrobiales bacterium]